MQNYTNFYLKMQAIFQFKHLFSNKTSKPLVNLVRSGKAKHIYLRSKDNTTCFPKMHLNNVFLVLKISLTILHSSTHGIPNLYDLLSSIKTEIMLGRAIVTSSLGHHSLLFT